MIKSVTVAMMMFFTCGLACFPSGIQLKPGGTFSVSMNAVGNVGGGEDLLKGTNLGDGDFTKAGESVEFEFWLSFAANSNNKRWKVWLSFDQLLYDSGSQARNGGSEIVTGRIVLTGDELSQLCRVEDAITATNLDLGSTANLMLTGEGVDDGDIICRALIVRAYPF